jgi:hypothetical protein
METLVRDADRRLELEAEMPANPLVFFESSMEVPEGWCETRGAFLLLSESYRGDAERSRTLGWPTVERLGGHLDIVNDADLPAPSSSLRADTSNARPAPVGSTFRHRQRG